MMDQTKKDAAQPDARRTPAPEADPRIDSRELLRGGRRLVILHNGEEYRLQLTRAQRLILTK